MGNMIEVGSILVVLVVMFAGLWLIGWACGDFTRKRT
jgi:hypothetical protein